MKKILLTVSYDGTNYNGWQCGNTGISIESILNNRISKLLSEDIKVVGASRTDAGVHAKMNLATFETNCDIRADKIYYGINTLLPKDISVLSSKEVDMDFNLRKIKTKKTYDYFIHSSKVREPLKNRYAHFVYYDIDVDKMREASKYLIGEHDFKSFINPESNAIIEKKSTVRTIYDIDINKNNDTNIIDIKIIGNGFLYNMVRIICGTLLKIGMGMWEADYIVEILEKKDRRYAGFTLPACGLVLSDIKIYDENI